MNFPAIIDFIINALDTFLKENPYAGAILAIVSIVANFIQIYEWTRQKRIAKQEATERALLVKELQTYRYLFDKADLHKQVDNILQSQQKTVDEKSKEIESLELAVAQRKDELSGLESRLEQLVLSARNEVVREEIEQRLASVRRELSAIQTLKDEYDISDTKLELPDDVKLQLQELIAKFKTESSDIPRSFVIKVGLLLAIILLLPFPIDTIVLLIISSMLFEIVTDTLYLFRNQKLIELLNKHYRFAVFVSLFALWASVLNWLGNIFEPVNIVARESLYDFVNNLITSSFYSYFFIEPYKAAHLLARSTVALVPILFAMVIAFLHYARIIEAVGNYIRNTARQRAG